MTFLMLFGFLSLLTAVIAFVWALTNRARIKRELHTIIWLFFVSILGDILSLILSIYGLNNLVVGNCFTIFQYVVLFFLLQDKGPSQSLKILFAASIGFALVNILFYQSINQFNSYTFYAATFILIVSGYRYLHALLKKRAFDDVKIVPMFWVTFGTIIYYAGTTFIFLFSNFLVEYFPEVHQKIWVLHNLLGITKNVMFFIALWVDFKRITFFS